MRTRQEQILASRPPRPAVRRPGARPYGGGRQAPATGGQRRSRGRGGGLEPPAPAPWDSTAERESAELGNERGDTNAALNSRYGEIQQDLGYGAGANNPYSEAADLKRQYEARDRASLNTSGASLYSGSTLNAARAHAFDYGEGSAHLQEAYDRATQAYERGHGETSRDYQLGIAKIKEGALNRALAEPPAPQAPGRRRPAPPTRRGAAPPRGRGRAPFPTTRPSRPVAY